MAVLWPHAKTRVVLHTPPYLCLKQGLSWTTFTNSIYTDLSPTVCACAPEFGQVPILPPFQGTRYGPSIDE